MSTSSPWRVMITGYHHDGRGVGYRIDKEEKREMRCWGTVIGDEILAWPRKKERGGIDCVLDSIITPSPASLPPHDNHWAVCGPFSRLPRERELEWKRNKLQGLFGHDVTLTYGEKRNHYRTKIEMSVRDGQLHFHNRGQWSRYISITKGCALMPDKANEIALSLLIHLAPYNPTTITIRWSHANHNAIASITFTEENNIPPLPDIIDLIGYRYCVKNNNHNHTFFSAGESFLTEKVLHNDIRYDHDSFFQNNGEVFRLLLKDALQILTPLYPKKILDWYGGVGSIGLECAVAMPNAKVMCRDSNAHAVACATHNAHNLGLAHRFETFACSAEEDNFSLRDFDCVIVDPPRAGLHSRVIRHLLTDLPPLVLYISCNPVTLARDLKLLNTQYTQLITRGFDMYPTTPHLEAMVVLRRH